MTDQSPAAPHDAAWSGSANDRAGVLAADRAEAPPMTAFPNAAAHRPDVITRRDTNLARGVAAGPLEVVFPPAAEAHATPMTPDVGGRIQLEM